MKIGLIADIHGNLQAMNAVLEALYRERVDLILCAGDLICYGAQCNHVIDLMRACNIPSVTGNYDAAVAWNLPSASSKPSTPANEVLKQAALDWTKKHIHSKHRDYLRTLPWTMQLRLDGLRITVLHAGIAQLDEWYTPDDPEGLSTLAAQLSGDIVLLGHTHRAFDYTVVDPFGGKTRFINPGAVGRSLDRDTRAAYAIFDTADQSVRLRRIDYDLANAVRAIMQSGMPKEIGLLIQYGARRIEELPTELMINKEDDTHESAAAVNR